MIRQGISLGVAAALALAIAPAVQTQNEKLEISAFAINMSNIGSGGTAVVEIRVNSWSTPEERQHLLSTAVEKNSDTLLRELQKAKEHGRFSIPGLVGPDPHNLRLGHDIRYAWQTALPDGGRRIVLATDRYIGFQEARNQPRTHRLSVHVDGDPGEQGRARARARWPSPRRSRSTRRRTRWSSRTTPASPSA